MMQLHKIDTRITITIYIRVTLTALSDFRYLLQYAIRFTFLLKQRESINGINSELKIFFDGNKSSNWYWSILNYHLDFSHST